MLRFDENGNLTFICSNCWSIIKVKGVTPLPKYHGSGGFRIYSLPDFNNCPVCGIPNSDYVFEVDPEIATGIAVLNIMGYTTYHSCSSHSRFDPDFYVVLDVPEGSNFDEVIKSSKSFEASKFHPDMNKPVTHYRLAVKSEVVFKEITKSEGENDDEIIYVDVLDEEDWKNAHVEHISEFYTIISKLTNFNHDRKEIRNVEIDVIRDNCNYLDENPLKTYKPESDPNMYVVKRLYEGFFHNISEEHIKRICTDICNSAGIFVYRRYGIIVDIKYRKEDYGYGFYTSDKDNKYNKHDFVIASSIIKFALEYVKPIIDYMSED